MRIALRIAASNEMGFSGFRNFAFGIVRKILLSFPDSVYHCQLTFRHVAATSSDSELLIATIANQFNDRPSDKSIGASAGGSVSTDEHCLANADELRVHEIQLFENSVSSFPYKKVTCAISTDKRRIH